MKQFFAPPTRQVSRRVWLIVLTCVALLTLTACQSAAYQMMETLGFEKRDILSNRVARARDAQDDAREQFSSALERFKATVAVEGGNLEEIYNRLDGEYRRSQSRAEAVSARIKAVEDVAGHLFSEWEGEIKLYTDPNLKRRSQAILDQTRERYVRMLASMRRAEKSMAPVLAVFRDQVLFLKHNLNSLAINSIRGEMAEIERATQALIEAMDASIRQANEFIATLDS